jgi:2-(3-amino-3-carboxypropyl)histidine synthase
MKDISSIKKELKKLKAKRIFIQFPEGLKLKIQDISKQLEKEGFETVICSEPTFGACDVRDKEALELECDAILHIGHSDLGIKSRVPVIYWEYLYDSDPTPILKHEIKKLNKFEKIGLVTSLQFVTSIAKAKSFLRNAGKKVFTHKALKYEGQILGCNIDAAKKIEEMVDIFLFIGSGKFHAIGIALKVNKPVFILDFEKKEIYNVEKEKRKFIKLIEWNRACLKDAKKIGILISWKRGQLKQKLVYQLKKKLEKKGKETYILAFDEITPEKIEGLKLDCLINCACPRISIDDIARYKIPILDSEIVLNT